MEAVFTYIKSFLALYLLIKVLIYFAPGNGFAKYISFFSGVVLVLGLLYPVLGVFSMTDALRIDMQKTVGVKDISAMSFWDNDSWEEGMDIYRLQLERIIETELENEMIRKGLSVKRINVRLTSDYQVEELKVILTQADETICPELAGQLEKEYQLTESQCEIVYE